MKIRIIGLVLLIAACEKPTDAGLKVIAAKNAVLLLHDDAGNSYTAVHSQADMWQLRAIESSR